MIEYRIANMEDGQRLIDLLLGKFWPEHKLGGRQLAPDIPKISRTIIDEMLNGTVFIAISDGKAVGSLGLHPFSPWWTSEQILADTWFFVDPEYRSKGVAKELLAMGKQFAIAQGKPMTVGVYNSHDSDRKDAFFRRSGFEMIGGWYLANGGE